MNLMVKNRIINSKNIIKKILFYLVLAVVVTLLIFIFRQYAINKENERLAEQAIAISVNLKNEEELREANQKKWLLLHKYIEQYKNEEGYGSDGSLEYIERLKVVYDLIEYREFENGSVDIYLTDEAERKLESINYYVDIY